VTAGALAGKGADPSLGAGRLFAGSDESPELASSLALRLPVSCPNVRWGLRPLPLARYCASLPALLTSSFGKVPSSTP